MALVNFKVIRNVAPIIIFNIVLYVVDYGLDINQYYYQKSNGHVKWANSILLVTFNPNIVAFISECIKTFSYVEKYARHKYEKIYYRSWDWKQLKVYHTYSYFNIRKWENLSRKTKAVNIIFRFLKHFLLAIIVFLLLIPTMILAPLILLVCLILEAFGYGLSDSIERFLDRNLHGWIIGENRLADGKSHHKQQRNTKEIFYDLFFSDR